MRDSLLGRRVLVAALALASIAAGTSARTYRNEALHVRSFEPPPGWEKAPQGSYPRLLAAYSHREGGHLTLSAQQVAPGTSALKLAEQARVPLERQGFTAVRVTADGARARLEATLDGGKRFGRQLYLVDGNMAFVVTLVAPQQSAAAMVRDFEESLRTLQIGNGAESIVR
jgi:hypothetical protein